MGSLIYSPGIKLIIDSTKKGIVDVSDDVISGSVTLNENSPHTINFALANYGRKYEGVFRPNDRFHLKLKRLKWLPIMSGYLNRVPFTQVWPGAVTFSGACTLKKLLTTFYDPGSTATAALFSQYASVQAGTSEDGGMTERAKAVLIQVGQWPEDAIHVGALPQKWFQTVSDLYTKISPGISPEQVVGSGGSVSGLPITGSYKPDSNNVLSAEDVARIAASVGFTGQNLVIAVAVAHAESGFKIDSDNPSSTATGLWQILASAHPSYNVARLASDPVYNAQAAWDISSHGANWHPWTTYNNGLSAADMRLAQQAVRAIASSPTDRSQTTLMPNQRPSGAPAKIAFPVPGAKQPLTHISGATWGMQPTDDFGADRNLPGVPRHTHQGNDIFAPVGTPCLAATDGVAERLNVTDNGPGGISLHIKDDLGGYTYYAHLQTITVTQGQRVNAGDQIGIVDTTGDAKIAGTPHLHFEWHPAYAGGNAVSPRAFLNAAIETGSSSSSGSLISGQFPTSQPSTSSQALNGARRLMNDTSVFPTIQALFNASMRSICSAPNGDFIAWFPDLFGQFGSAAVINIEDIELENFQVGWTDTGLVTHQFVTGSFLGWTGEEAGLSVNSNPEDVLTQMLQTMGIATVEFPDILKTMMGTDSGDWVSPHAILEWVGARPSNKNIPALVTPEAEFFFALHYLMQSWARQFNGPDIPVSFMPELWPGMIMRVKSQNFQVYVQSVTHSWDLSQGAGFSTNATVIAPATTKGHFLGPTRFGTLGADATPKRSERAPA